MESDLKTLSKKDLIELLTLSSASLAVDSESALKEQVFALKDLIPFEASVCAHGHLPGVLKNPKPQINVLNVSYSPDYLRWYLKTSQHMNDPVLARFLKTNQPIHWAATRNESGVAYPQAIQAVDFDMNDGWTFGFLDKKEKNGTAIYLGSEKKNASKRSKTIVEYIVPFFAKAYIRVLQEGKNRAPINRKLTPRETEVLNWIKEGKSSWEISMILNCSKSNIEFHVTNIKNKLDALNRTQAVVIALEQGLINF